MTELGAKIAKHEALFDEWRVRNPSGKFSDFSMQRVVAGIKRGQQHTTLGTNIVPNIDTTGAKAGDMLVAKSNIESDDKVCEYGCGTLRVGQYFIRRQEAGCFFGLDVSDDLIKMGRDMIGESLMQSKRPTLGTIGEMLHEAVSADIDILYSLNVLCHVHPEELDTYFNNVHAICRKAGSRAYIHAMTHATPVRYQESGWALPLETVIARLQPMTVTEAEYLKTVNKNGVELSTYLVIAHR